MRGAQVGAVNAMMRYVREGAGETVDLPPGFDQPPTETDYETGEEVMETEGEVGSAADAAKTGGADGTTKGGLDAVDAFLQQERQPPASPKEVDKGADKSGDRSTRPGRAK